MQKRAISREGGDIDAVALLLLRAPRFNYKNFAGSALLRIIKPTYNNILKSYWKSDDLRTALQQRLQG